MKTKQLFTIVVTGLMMLGLTTGCDTQQANIEQTTALAEEAYIYGLGPMVYYRLYSEQLLAATKSIDVNVLDHRRKLSDHNERGGQAPNHDTMYSLTWLDIAKEPLVIQIPDYGDRFYGIQMTTMYQNNFQNIGNSMAYGNRDAYKKQYTYLPLRITSFKKAYSA